jgi:hypothetical protein
MRSLAQIERELQALVDNGELGEASLSVLTDVLQDIKEMQTVIGAAVASTEGVVRLPDKTGGEK